ncbi:hypothetical protein LCGC14_1778000 [marine sediment metagenome]|uniref:Uncharacterized protein n=1 Tax=marine sediment metagenome TaxID=412755 RepID=A0A0F9HIS8_9ZZZZ
MKDKDHATRENTKERYFYKMGKDVKPSKGKAKKRKKGNTHY